jgi:rhodanese-related sulfurtransferase
MAIPEITVDELARRIGGGNVVLFDVRNPDEYVSAHVGGAVLVPLHEVPDRVGEFPASGEVLVICKSGGRSGQAVEFLREQGVDAINIAGGTMAWIQAGHPVETGGVS